MWPEFSHRDVIEPTYRIETPLAHWDGDLNDYEFQQYTHEGEK